MNHWLEVKRKFQILSPFYPLLFWHNMYVYFRICIINYFDVKKFDELKFICTFSNKVVISVFFLYRCLGDRTVYSLASVKPIIKKYILINMQSIYHLHLDGMDAMNTSSLVDEYHIKTIPFSISNNSQKRSCLEYYLQ